jgi:dolichol-phosphate mannosyltransferase
MISLYPEAITKMIKSPFVVIIPIYNEAESIESVVKEWINIFMEMNIDFQFVLLNDGSSDSTLSVLQILESSFPNNIISVNKPNSGHGRTCRVGYDAAVEAPSVEWILQIDSDGQCDPKYFPSFWSQRSNADCIYGKRVQRDDGFSRIITSKLCRFGSSLLGGCDMQDANVPYRLIRREVLASALKRIPASFNIHNTAMTFILKKTKGIKWAYIPIRFRDRQGGSNSINLINVAHMGIDMLIELRKLK